MVIEGLAVHLFSSDAIPKFRCAAGVRDGWTPICVFAGPAGCDDDDEDGDHVSGWSNDK